MDRSSVIVPTIRAVALIALAAPVALVIAAAAPQAWIVAPLLGLALVVLIVIDALVAGLASDVRLTLFEDAEVGAETWLQVEAEFVRGRPRRVECAISADSRLLPGGGTEAALFPLKDGGWQVAIGYCPNRRGTGQIGRLWLRWTGPLGLGSRQMWRDAARNVRVWPNIEAVRSPAMQTFLRQSQFGMIARRLRGEGTQFEALAEYRPGMDRRRIDWKSSARHVHLLAREYETERNNQVVFAIDCGQAMCEPVDGMPRIDRAVSAALATAYVALKGGDRVALYGFAARPQALSPFVAEPRQFAQLQRAAASLDYQAQEPNFTLAMATLSARLQRHSLIVVFSEFSDPTSAELMLESIGRLVRRHLVVFVTLADTELDHLANAEPDSLDRLGMAVTAEALLRQRALVTSRLRSLGVDVIEAHHDSIGARLIDAYLSIKRRGAIG